MVTRSCNYLSQRLKLWPTWSSILAQDEDAVRQVIRRPIRRSMRSKHCSAMFYGGDKACCNLSLSHVLGQRVEGSCQADCPTFEAMPWSATIRA
jgi:hypothetical protein